MHLKDTERTPPRLPEPSPTRLEQPEKPASEAGAWVVPAVVDIGASFQQKPTTNTKPKRTPQKMTTTNQPRKVDKPRSSSGFQPTVTGRNAVPKTTRPMSGSIKRQNTT